MNVLIIAPHQDDEVLGCGGTIVNRVARGDNVFVCVVTKGREPLFNEEYVEKVLQEGKRADEFLGVKEVIYLDFPAVMLEDVPRYRLNDAILEVIKKISPSEVYIPHRGDMQMDHKIVADAAMVALRPKYNLGVRRIYAYETLSETGWDIPNVANEFIPAVYEDISSALVKKVSAMRFFESQLQEFPNARSIEAIEALAKYRGSTILKNAAEAFVLIREIRD